MIIRVVGIDAAFANMGLVAAYVNPLTGQVACIDMDLVKTESDDRKVVRKSSSDLGRAKHLVTGLSDWCHKHRPILAFAEVPSGSQSAAAGRALGIAVGVIASCPVEIIEVAPIEIKRLFSKKNESISKQVIIDWAVAKWPDAPWLRQRGRITKNNEHLADAMATIVAGIKVPAFKQLMALQGATETPSRARKVLL